MKDDTQNEFQLIELARSGDSAAFCALAELHGPRLYRQALMLGRDAVVAEDVVQDTMLEAWRAMPRFDGRCKLATWLSGILFNRHRKANRRPSARPVPAIYATDIVEHSPSLSSPENQMARAEDAARIRAAVEALPDEQGLVVQMRFFAGATLEEIAGALGEPLGTIKSRLHHAIRKLREMKLSLNFLDGRRE